MNKEKVDLSKYEEFVLEVMSPESKDINYFYRSLDRLEEKNVNIPMLITSCLGLSGETGEYVDIVKKMLFQGKEFTDEVKERLKSELSDAFWYLAAACMSLDISMDEVVEFNVEKLVKRYPTGSFDVFSSENRKEE